MTKPLDAVIKALDAMKSASVSERNPEDYTIVEMSDGTLAIVHKDLIREEDNDD